MMMEKALPAKRRRAAKGTVLFTVVAVMMVLIVFLMGTLALAATANNRAHAVYQKAQTEATARAVLEAAYQAIADDTTATGIRSNVTAATTTTPGTVDVHLSDTNQTYRVEIYDSGDNKSYYDPVERKWNTSKIYRLSVTVDKTKADTTYNAFITAKTETTPGHGGGGGGGGAFVSMGNATTIATGGFVSGGSYLGIDEKLYTYQLDPSGNVTTALANYQKDAAGDLVLDANGDPIPIGNVKYVKPSFTTSNNEVYVDAPYYVNGNLTTGGGQGFTVHFREFGDLFYVNGNFTESQAEQFRTDYTGFIQPTGTKANYKNTPYIFIEGEFALHGDKTTYIGQKEYKGAGNVVTAGAPTNLYANRLNTNGNGIEIYGDIYLLEQDPKDDTGADYINKIGTSSDAGNSKLYEWTKTAVSNNPSASTVYGNLFSRGSVEYYTTGHSYVQGDFRCEKDVTFKGSETMEIGGNLVVGGTLKLDGCNLKVNGNIYADSIDNSGNKTITCENDLYYVTGISGTAPMTSRIAPTVTTGYWYEATAELTTGGHTTAGGTYDFNVSLIEHVTENGVPKADNVLLTNGLKNAYVNPGQENDFANSWAKELIDAAGITVGCGDNNAVNNNKTASNQKTNTTSGARIPTPQHTASSVADAYGEIYPSGYTLANIKTTINQDKPKPTKYTSYYTNSTDATFAATIPTATTSTSSLTIDPSGKYYVITADTYLKNLTIDKNIYINPATKNIRVIFENVQMGDSATGSDSSIIANDSVYQTEIYIIGTLKFLSKGAIATEYYWKELVSNDLAATLGGNDQTSKDFDAAGNPTPLKVRQLHKKETDPDYPNLIIMSDPGATLDMKSGANNCLITAMVRAPQMTFAFAQAQELRTLEYYENNTIDSSDNANYDGAPVIVGANANDAKYKTMHPFSSISDASNAARSGLNPSKITTIGLIGQLIAGKIDIPNTANFGMVYVDIPSGTVITAPPTPPSTNPFAGQSSVLFYDYY